MPNRVLIFDDDEDILEICSLTLEANGYQVLVETDCEDLFIKLRAASPNVVIMDNKIAGFGGVTASRQIKQSGEFGKVPVIFFTANSNAAKLADEAMSDYLIEKPFDLDYLVDVVNKACER